MKKSVLEFSRPLQVDRVPRGGSFEKIAADPAECVALARRLALPAIHALTATLKATPWRGGGLKLDGALTADLDQVSVVSLEAFRSSVTFPVLRYYLPAGATSEGDEEDADPIVAGHVDLGEAVSETLALELDPYPRKAGEDFAGPREDQAPAAPERESPFAALARIKKD
jgi:hypothetical protein